MPLAAIAVVGSFAGGRLALKTKPRALKTVFACTTLAAAAFMIVSAVLSG